MADTDEPLTPEDVMDFQSYILECLEASRKILYEILKLKRKKIPEYEEYLMSGLLFPFSPSPEFLLTIADKTKRVTQALNILLHLIEEDII